MKKRIAVLAVIATACVAPALAIFGVGDIVYDPTNFEEAVKQLLQMEQQYAQLVQTYQMVRSQYEQMIWMAQKDPVNMVARYRALATPWQNSSATNTYGTTAAWVRSINSGLGMLDGYAKATQPLGAYGAALGNIPADQLDRVKTTYATVELTDGANLAALATLCQLPGNATPLETATPNLA